MDDFDFDEPLLSGAARNQLLDEAAAAIDALAIHMGEGGDRGKTALGDYARDFKEDEAIPRRPGVFRASAEAIDPKRHDIPVDVQELLESARFYWIWLPVRLYARAGWGFNHLEVRATFDSGPTKGAGATALYLLPDPVFREYFKGNETLEVGIDSRLKARVGVPPIAAGQPGGPEIEFDAGGGVEVKGKSSYIFGPFDYRLTAAKIKTWGAGDNDARWRLAGAKYLNEGDPGLRVMLRVPNDAPELTVRVSIMARRYFSMMEASFQDKVLKLGEAFAAFLKKGAPIGGVQEFDLTTDM